MGAADNRGRAERLLVVLAAWSLLPIIAGSVVPGSAVAAAPTESAPLASAPPGAAPDTDFNGDGFADLAVVEADAVQISYGSSTGLRASQSRRFTRPDMTAAPPARHWGQNDGLELTTADFDGDGFCDLAIGDDTAVENGVNEAGAVHVLYGSTAGLSAARSQYWTQDTSGVQGRSERGDRFGVTLAAADFGRGHWADLAIGIPFEDVGRSEAAGAVIVLYGSADGLTAAGDQLWTQDSTRIRGKVETEDQFGRSLAAANFDGSGPADLAVGAPFESVGRSQAAGGINVLYGSADGLAASGNQFWSQATPGIGGHADSEDFYGYALAAGHLAGRPYADLAVSIINKFNVRGAVQVIYGTAGGLSARGDQLWSYRSTSLPERVRKSQFGDALAIANYGQDTPGGVYDDLAIGTAGPEAEQFGGVLVLYGTARGLTAANHQAWDQDVRGIPGTSEEFDRFGGALAGADFGYPAAGGDYADLAIGSPGERIGRARSAGRLHVLYGTAKGLTANHVQVWDAGKLKGRVATNTEFGHRLQATGR